MAQTKKAQEQQNNQQENQNNQTQVNLEENQRTQTPPSRQAGYNQPIHSREMTRSEGEQSRQSEQSGQNRGLTRREQSTPISPFSFMRRFSEDMDRLFGDFGFGGGFLAPSFGSDFDQMTSASLWSPQMEVFEREGQLVVHADLPGMTKDDLHVDLEDNQLIIHGERRNEREQNQEGVYHTERSYGSFYRSIPLPEGVDAEQANASFQNGVLEITVPLPQQKSRGRRLEISEGGQSEQKNQRNQKSQQNQEKQSSEK